MKEELTGRKADYERIAKAIEFIVERAVEQPSLDEVAAQVHLSPAHFQRVFARWAGVSPKRFLQALTVDRAKVLLREQRPVLEVSDSLGLSGGSRLYDHFVQLEAVTPGEFQSGGEGLAIEWGRQPTPFGEAFVAVTPRGICGLEFLDEGGEEECLVALKKRWPSAKIRENPEAARATVETMFGNKRELDRPLSLHVSGTNFQVSVWKALLTIPEGKVTTYHEIAEAIGRPKASRAVGSAVGRNPVAFVIPCHRVIRTSGGIGGFRWGVTRKHAIHAWESARIDLSAGDSLLGS